MSSLPCDLTPDILVVLPVKDLLRFRCVCSSWRSLIDSPYFTKLHLFRSQKTRINLFLLDKYLGRIRFLGIDSVDKAPEILQLPPIRSADRVVIAGSCNGVVALYNLDGGDVVLWNPSTRKLRELSSPKITTPNPGLDPNSRVVHGFGYDSVMDDYKLLRIVKFKNHPSSSFITKVEVFSLKSDTRREIEWPFPSLYVFAYTRSEALVNNALHWICYFFLVSVKIVAFDLVKEEFYLVPHPDYDPCLHSPHVGKLGGCLSVAINHASSPFALHVWVMDEYNVKESWSKILFLPLTQTRRDPSPLVIPIAYSRDRRRILLDYSRHLSWYDLTSKTLHFVKDRYIYEPTLCMGSLTALDWKTK